MLRFLELLPFHSNLHADADSDASLPVDAHRQLATAVPLAEFQHDLGVERQNERPKAQAARADRCDEKRLHKRVDDRTAGAEGICRRPGGRADEDTVRHRLGKEVVVDVDIDDRQVWVHASIDRNLVDRMKRRRASVVREGRHRRRGQLLRRRGDT